MRINIFTRVIVACALVVVPAHAKVKKIQITSKQSPAFGGYSWPGVGQYEKIVGKAFGELDPKDPKNKIIVDLQLAPRNAAGKVEYAFDFYILKPIDLSKGNHKMLYEPPNRGRKTIAALNRGVGGNDPGSVMDATLLGKVLDVNVINLSRVGPTPYFVVGIASSGLASRDDSNRPILLFATN